VKLSDIFPWGRAKPARPEPTIEELLARLARQRRTAWLPRTADGPTGLAGSKFGGLPLLASGEPWPACGNCRRPMQLFLQLNGEELPAELELPLPGRVVQLFYCTSQKPCCEADCEAWDGRGVSMRLRLIDARTPPQPLTASPVANAFPEKRIEGWEPVDDFPNAEDAEGAGETLDEIEQEMLSNAGYPREKDKLAGWPSWVQSVNYPACPECERAMRPLFQVDSHDNLPYMFGDAGVLHLFLCPQHPERLGMNWDCA
jgi:uncharacterized protein YwqG